MPDKSFRRFQNSREINKLIASYKIQRPRQAIGRIKSGKESFMFHMGQFSCKDYKGGGPFINDLIPKIHDTFYKFSELNPLLIIDISSYDNVMKSDSFLDFAKTMKNDEFDADNYYIKLLLNVATGSNLAWPIADNFSGDINHIFLSYIKWFELDLYKIIKSIDNEQLKNNFITYTKGMLDFDNSLYFFFPDLEDYINSDPSKFMFKRHVLWEGEIGTVNFQLKAYDLPTCLKSVL